MPRIDLHSGPEAPSAGLRALATWLAGLDTGLADRVLIAAGELLGNVVEHGPGGPFALEWSAQKEGGTLRIVGGGQVALAAIAEAELPETSATGGRGLFILRSVASRLAVDPDGALRLDFDL